MRKEYEERHEYWASTLPEGEFKQAAVVASYRPAIEYFDVRDAQLIPALLADDRTRAHRILNDALERLYVAHRLAIDEVIGMTIKRIAGIEGGGGGIPAVAAPLAARSRASS